MYFLFHNVCKWIIFCCIFTKNVAVRLYYNDFIFEINLRSISSYLVLRRHVWLFCRAQTEILTEVFQIRFDCNLFQIFFEFHIYCNNLLYPQFQNLKSRFQSLLVIVFQSCIQSEYKSEIQNYNFQVTNVLRNSYCIAFKPNISNYY